MKFRVADFEKLSLHFTVYNNGLNKIEEYRKEILIKVDPLRKEMQSIIVAAESGIVLDSKSENERVQRFQQIQSDLMSIDKEVKVEMTKKRDDLTKEVYNQLQSIVEEWSKENSIDLVFGKIEVVYLKPEFEITNDIIDILKQKNLYCESLDLEKQKLEKESV
jgi:Skp family chaperone for outer membrane proteins